MGIGRLAKKYGLKIIEDCPAHGAMQDEKIAGILRYSRI